MMMVLRVMIGVGVVDSVNCDDGVAGDATVVGGVSASAVAGSGSVGVVVDKGSCVGVVVGSDSGGAVADDDVVARSGARVSVR